MRGVIREDDLQSGKYDNPNLVPDRDPWIDEFRSVHHFYDPVADATGLGAGGSFFAGATRSPTWALGVADQAGTWLNNQTADPARGNHFSYMDARKQYFLALTYKDPPGISQGPLAEAQLRINLWATMFKSLGHVVHLLQDTASPQHVRAEGHSFLCNGGFRDDIPEQPVATRTFENYNNFRVTFLQDRILQNAGVAARYSFSNFCDDEKWRGMFDAAGQSTPTNLAAWNQNYPIPSFPIQRMYFTTRAEDTPLNSRRGLADYGNRGFFTEGAFEKSGGLPDPQYASPPALFGPDFVEGTTGTVVLPGLGSVFLRSLFWRVPDAVNPNYPDANLQAGRAPIVSKGTWSDDVLLGSGLPPDNYARGMLSLDNYSQMADMLAPRAVAYSAGLINFFFRGKLVIEPPVDGLFGAIDHGIGHAVVDGYPECTVDVTTPENWCTIGRVYGFTKLRLKIRNATEAIVESGTGAVIAQDMVATVAAPTTGTNAGLYAIARYHRNPCYRPDLSGERTIDASGTITAAANCNNGVRTDFQEISVSRPLVVQAAALNSTTTTAMAFDFSDDPIPINATDLVVQVVYRGQLGSETDGIAIGSIEINEPSYLTYWNNSDFGGCNGAWVTPSFPAGCGGLGVTFTLVRDVNLCVGSQLLLSHLMSQHSGIQVGNYLRIAVLMDDRLLSTRSRSVLTDTTEIRNYVLAGQQRQSEREIPTVEFPYVVEPFFKKRGFIGSFRPLPFYKRFGTDPQPLSDSGPLDVGNLNPPLITSQPPDPATFNFPDTAVSNAGACPPSTL